MLALVCKIELLKIDYSNLYKFKPPQKNFNRTNGFVTILSKVQSRLRLRVYCERPETEVSERAEAKKFAKIGYKISEREGFALPSFF